MTLVLGCVANGYTAASDLANTLSEAGLLHAAGREPPMVLALKSGNFGGSDFFADALEAMHQLGRTSLANEGARNHA